MERLLQNILNELRTIRGLLEDQKLESRQAREESARQADQGLSALLANVPANMKPMIEGLFPGKR